MRVVNYCLKIMYVNSLAYVRLKGGESESFIIDSGVIQGCIISPSLFHALRGEEKGREERIREERRGEERRGEGKRREDKRREEKRGEEKRRGEDRIREERRG